MLSYFIFVCILIGGGILHFDDFKLSQNICYSLLKNSVVNNKISHAYLIDSNGNDDCYDFVMSFVKMLVCPKHLSSFSDVLCDGCNICNRIDNNVFSDVKIIESDSFVIKKEQLLELQSDFSSYSIEGNYRIYIIKDCDKMNKQASNSLLKFLEEPADGIIAILVTNNVGKVLSTIASRCQVIHMMNNLVFSDSSYENFAYVYCNDKISASLFMENDKNYELMQAILEFIVYFEENGLDVLLFMKKMWYNYVQTRDDYLLAFQIILYFYYDVLKYYIFKDKYLFCSNVDLIEKVASYNNLDLIIKKLDVVQYGYDMILSNLNSNLLLDDILIKLGDVK